MQNPEIQKFIEGLMEESGFNNVAVDMELMKLIRQNDQKSVKLSAIREYTKLMRRGIHDKAAYRREEIEAKVVDDDSLSEEEREQLDQIAIEEAKMHDDNLRRENNELKRELDLIKKKVA